jgi:predicted pyridoxine 5'-phosphate oxidase superfamily flavin-nucleotide-binding protein
MTSRLSDWAREFLREDRVAVVSTLNTDGSPQVTTIWYLLQEDGTLIMSTPGRTQKVKNLRCDPQASHRPRVSVQRCSGHLSLL